MAAAAAQHKLGNFIAFLDYNKRQLDGYVEEINSIEDQEQPNSSFNWLTVKIKGDDPDLIQKTIFDIQKKQGDKPAMIVLDTVKGMGVQEVIDIELNHHITISRKTADQIIVELKLSRKDNPSCSNASTMVKKKKNGEERFGETIKKFWLKTQKQLIWMRI